VPNKRRNERKKLRAELIYLRSDVGSTNKDKR
jgi:hypothetical protein